MRRRRLRELILVMSACSLCTMGPFTAWAQTAQTTSIEAQLKASEERERIVRMQAIASFTRFIEQYPDDAKATPQAMMQLAELHFEQAADEFSRQMRAYEERGNSAPSNGEVPRKNYQHVIALYRQLIEKFPNAHDIDGVYYLLGYALSEQGQESEAEQVFAKLISQYPASRFVIEAHMRMGERAFDENRLQAAITAYQKAASDTRHPLYDKALYKLAWSHYRLDQFADAIHNFSRVITLPGGNSESELRSESLQYIALSLAEDESANLSNFERYFEDARAPWLAEVLINLGDIHVEKEEGEKALLDYQMAIEKFPLGTQALTAQSRLIQQLEKMGRGDEAMRIRESFLALYVEPGAKWVKANQADAKNRAKKLLQGFIENIADYHVQQAQEAKAKGDMAKSAAEYSAAADQYKIFLKYLKSSNTQILYRLADCEYFSGQYESAAERYSKIASNAEAKEYQEPAGYGAILALEKWATGKAPQEKKKRVSAEDNIQVIMKKIVQASDAYLKLFANNSKAPKVAYKAAIIAHQIGMKDESRRRLEELIIKYPQDSMAVSAFDSIVSELIAQENNLAISAFTEKIERGIAQSDATLIRNKIKEIKFTVAFAKAEKFQKAEKYPQAAAAFEEAAKSCLVQDSCAKALYNSALNYERSRLHDRMRENLVTLQKNYPRSELADDALARLGRHYERFYEFSAAALAQFQLAQEYPQSELRADALLDSGKNFTYAGLFAEAARSFWQHVQSYPQAPERVSAWMKAIENLENAGDFTNARKRLDEFLKQYKQDNQHIDESAYAHLKMAGYAEKQGNFSQAKTLYQSLINESRASNERHAEAAFRLTELGFQDYERISMSDTPSEQKFAIVMRAQKLKELKESYQKVFSYGEDAWTLAALTRIGNLYESFADMLYQAKIPKNVSQNGAEYVETYRALLEEKATPLEEQAVQAYKRALEEFKKRGLRGEWLQKTYASLHKLRKREYPKATLEFQTGEVFIQPTHNTAAPQKTSTAQPIQKSAPRASSHSP